MILYQISFFTNFHLFSSKQFVFYQFIQLSTKYVTKIPLPVSRKTDKIIKIAQIILLKSLECLKNGKNNAPMFHYKRLQTAFLHLS